MTQKRIVILGAGESGVGAAILAKREGFEVFVTDSGIINEKYKNVLIKAGIEFEEGRHTLQKIISAGEIIKSPGIPDDSEAVRFITEKNISLISEIEFAARYSKGKKICITGSNGKTTSTMLIYHILQKAEIDAGLAGNVGKSFAWQVAEGDHDWWVIELSSFQLDGMFDFKAEVAILLNITPDHLDRYDNDFQKYVDSKFRIINNQSDDDYFIYCSDDEVIVRSLGERKIKAKQFPFSISNNVEEGFYDKQNQLKININQTELSMYIHELALQGRHNLYDSLAAGIASRILDIRKDTIKECLMDFQGVEHRLEYVTNVHGIEFINDSKATNVNSTWYALECMSKKVIWIAGGKDKGNDYSVLQDLVKRKVKAIVCMGLDNRKIHKAFSDCIKKIEDAETATDAVKAAYRLAKPGDVVLLSPSCASFDLFENYEERGRKFKDAVREL